MLFQSSAYTLIITLILLLNAPKATAQTSNTSTSNPDLKDIAEQIQCYNLPYGGIGFLSHVLTYYAIACVGLGLRPLTPWLLTTRWTFDIVISLISLTTSNTMAIITMYNCRHEWQFLLLGVWNAIVSCTLGAMCIHRCKIIRAESEPAEGVGCLRTSRVLGIRTDKDYTLSELFSDKKALLPFWWLAPYMIGVVIGLTGLISLVIRYWGEPQVQTVTITFAGLAATLLIVGYLVEIIFDEGMSLQKRLAFGVALFIPTAFALLGFFGVLYSDWALGVMTGNLIGMPGTANPVLFWTYFVAKRVPLAFS